MPESSVSTPPPELYERAGETPKRRVASTQRRRLCGLAPLTFSYLCMANGVLLIALALVFAFAVPAVVTDKVNAGAAVCDLKDVQEPPFTDQYGDCDECYPYFYSLYLFNATNAADYLTNQTTLRVQELGPYVYRRRQIKLDVNLSSDSASVSYRMYTYHTFDASRSCASCSELDAVTTWDIGYLSVISQAGGERGFLHALIRGSPWGQNLTLAEREAIVRQNGSTIMRLMNGFNANQPSAWKRVGSAVIRFLAFGLPAIQGVEPPQGFEYEGVFARRPVRDWALGYPSLLAGLSIGTHYVKACNSTNGYDARCASCRGDECLALWYECKRCAQGQRVQRINAVTCGAIERKYAAVYGAEEAKIFVASTCGGLCATSGICAAPIPGTAEASGIDYSRQAPPLSALNKYTQRTGCRDKTEIGVYEEYDGYRKQPMWAALDTRRLPTLAEMSAFARYSNCERPPANVTCSDVIGSDATGLAPRGASLSHGFPDKVSNKRIVMFLSQAKQNITLVNSGRVVDDVDGIKLTRFVPPRDLLHFDAWKGLKGTAFPVDGLQSLAFNLGFLSFLSFPLFLHGDRSLMERVEMTLFDGQRATPETLLDANGELKPRYFDRYQTVVDVEPGTGKTFRVKKLLMASYALAKSSFTPGAAMSDILWPNATAEVIVPGYIGAETATITSHRVDAFKKAERLLRALVPTLVVGIVFGVGFIAGGLWLRRRELIALSTSSVNVALF
ncbi:hypothetical protein ATCC90586_006601 [Pythium insidiosum]|nr:hypothetical protein ATCC90586_006601 [Pythium insidiosum]